jgi:DNA-binding protein YbaB
VSDDPTGAGGQPVPEIRNLTDLAEYAQDQIERITRMQQQLNDYVGEGESPHRHVRARTGPGGKLLDLQIRPEALRLTADGLGAEVTAAVTAAQADFATRSSDIMAPLLAMRPSEQTTDTLEHGLERLDALSADLERLAQRRDLLG